MISETEDAWAAGFFDGEGCVTLRSGFYPALVVVQTKGPELLERFRAITGLGTISVRKSSNPRWAQAWSYHVERVADVEVVLARLWPYLGTAKREQASRALSVWRNRDLLRAAV